MLYKVNLNGEESFMGKSRLASLFTFYMVKIFVNILKWKSLSVKEGEGGRGGYTNRQILLKNSKINC